MTYFPIDGTIEVLLPKIAFEKSKLITSEIYEDLSQIKDLNQLLLRMRDLSYKGLIEEGIVKLEQLEYSLKENLFAFFIKIIRSAPKNYQDFFKTYLLKYEIENIQKILRGIYKNLKKEIILKELHLSIELVFNRVKFITESLDALDLHSLVHTLSKLPYGEVIREAFLIFERERFSFFYFDLFLELNYLEQLWEAHLRLNQRNRQIIRQFIGPELDCYNLETILRAKALSINEPLMYRMISNKNDKINQKMLDRLIRGTIGVDQLINLLNFKRAIIEKPFTPEKMHQLYLNELLQLISFYYINSDFDIGKSFALLKHKELEIENLRTISIGINYRKSATEIFEKLKIVERY